MSSTKLMLPAVEVALLSDPGRDPSKQENEDSCRHAETPFGHLVVVCDGMGGHEAGRVAAETAVDALFRYLDAAPLRPDIPPADRAREVLRDGIATANRAVLAIGSSRVSSRPGSTLVAVLVHSLGTEVAHVGDSRCYFVTRGAIRQLTRDHSMVQQLVDAGQLSPAQASAHPDANQITRALGAAEGVDVDVQKSSVPHVAGDSFVLCSDGLTDLVDAATIQAIVTPTRPHEAARRLVDLANERGGHDNVTVAVVNARESALVPREAATSPAAFRMTEAVPVVIPVDPAQSPGARARLPDRHGGGREPLLRAEPGLPNRWTGVNGRRSPFVALAVALALVALVIAGTVFTLVAPPQPRAPEATALSPSIVLPSASLAPPSPADSASDLDVEPSATDASTKHGRTRPRPRR
jgi:protein phosphatase